jgi:hypothetical protein
MELFLELEIVYIVIGLFILSIAAFVTSRDFMPKGAFKKGMGFVLIFVLTLISIHYTMTTSRMNNTEEMFTKGETLICENKMRRTISNSILLSKEMGWRLEGHLFKHPDYMRDFHTSRCVEWIGSKPQIAQAKKEAEKKDENLTKEESVK